MCVCVCVLLIIEHNGDVYKFTKGSQLPCYFVTLLTCYF